MPAPRRLRKSLGFEPLEDRSLPAGNVVAVLTEGLLTILGDANSNSVTLSHDTASGKTYVSGNSLEGSATLVNGQDTSVAGFVPFTGVQNVQVRLAEGNDQLSFGTSHWGYTPVPGQLDIEMGAGNDTVALGRAGNVPGSADPVRSRVFIGQGSFIDLGAGNDSLDMANMKVNKSLVIFASDGDDSVEFATEFTPAGATAPTLFPVVVRGNVHINLGVGVDSLTGGHAVAGQNFLVADPAGATTIDLVDIGAGEKLAFSTGHDVDHIAVDRFFADQFNVHTGGGADDVDLAHGRVKRTNVNLGDGFDDFRLRWTRSSQYTLLDGGGNGADYSQTGNVLRSALRRRLS